MHALAIVVCLFLVAGCAGRDSDGGTAHEIPEACGTAQVDTHAQQLASIAPVDGGKAARATTWVMYDDLTKLARASSLIVRGRVIADCAPDDSEGASKNSDSEPRMLVEVDTFYRGQQRDSVLVPATSDAFSSSSSLRFTIGNEVILFLGHVEDGEVFLVGGPQGHWRVANGRTFPNVAHFEDVSLDTFADMLEAALR